MSGFTGAYASAVQDENNKACYAPTASTVTFTGDWATQEVATNISGTTEEVRTDNVRVGTSSENSPSITWSVYVSAPGTYDVFLLVPGCTNMQDCDARTTVQVTTNPGGGLPTTRDRLGAARGGHEAEDLQWPHRAFWTGLLINVQMTLAENPAGTGANGVYHLVADRVAFSLVTDSTGSDANGTSTTNTTIIAGKSQSFGFFEWPLSSNATINSDGLFPNTSVTNYDFVGFNLTAELGKDITDAACARRCPALGWPSVPRGQFHPVHRRSQHRCV